MTAGMPAALAADIEKASGNTIWSNPTQWVQGIKPGAGDRAIFAGTGTIAINANEAVGQMVWQGSTDTDMLSNLASTHHLTVHGIDGLAIDVQSNFTPKLFNWMDLASDQIWRASNVAGGGFETNSGSPGNIALGANTLTIDLVNAANHAQLSTQLTGPGNLVKTGLGTLGLTAVSSYTGSTRIEEGTLELIGAGSIMASSGVVANGTFSISGLSGVGTNIRALEGGASGVVDLATKRLTLTAANGDFAGVIQGTSGGITIASGTQILSGENTYTGNTVIGSGSNLQLGAGGTSGNIAGDVSNSGSLVFNRSDVFTFSGKVSGGGSVGQVGTGTTILTGENTYTGLTTIDAGALQVGDGGISGSIAGNVLNRGTLTFNRSNEITYGGIISGNGEVKQIGTGKTILTENSTYTGLTTIEAGTLELGAAGLTGSIVGNVLNNGTLSFNRLDGLIFGGQISGSGGVDQIGTSVTLTGQNGYLGTTSVWGGMLFINGDQSAATGLTQVFGGATLGGNGVVGGDVEVADGAILNPGDDVANTPSTLTINGDLRLGANATLEYQFGEANTVGGAWNDHIVVGGDLVLGGTINVTTSAGGTFDPGIYRVITYSGALTNGGLNIGTIPSTSYYVQTSIDKQVNLINTAGMALNYWDGAAGPKNSGTIEGGNGSWQQTTTRFGNDHWADMAGAVNAPSEAGAFAIFGGTAGTVTVDNNSGSDPVSASGMQFASDGYIIQGDALELTGGPTSIIRVGDGTAASAGWTATIASDLSGSTQVVKSDAGTLVLSGVNTYTGGTAINGGTLQVSNDGNLGAAAGGLSFDGGALRTTADMATGRSVDLASGGGTLLADTGTMLTLNGTVSGTGSLTNMGAGTVVLTDANTYTGGTFLNGGTLSVSADGNLGDTSGALSFNGGTLQNTAAMTSGRSVTLDGSGGTLETDADLTWSGVIAGAGPLAKSGSSTLVLTGENTYTGGTTISEGTVQVGDGGTSGSIDGNVLNNSTLAFNRSDDLTIEGIISGSGAVNQIGTGTTILTGDNTYTGGTTISSGTLQIGDGGTSGSIEGDVANNSALAFNRGGELTIEGIISGSGAVNQIGTGTTILTGENTYTGGTTISSGTLQIGNGGTSGSFTGDVVNDGALAFNRSDDLTIAGVISGSGDLRQIGSGRTTLTGDSSSFAGTTNLEAGTLAVNGSLCGQVNVRAGARLEGTGTVCDTTNFAGGTIAPGDPSGTLTVDGDYVGNGGTLEIGVELGDDTSPTDMLVITGDTSGSTNVVVINLGGAGAQTVEGIKIVDVGGASNGAFVLQGDYVSEGEQAVVGGAYAYRLYKNGVSTPTDGDWYLRSALRGPDEPGPNPGDPNENPEPLYQPGVPLYEAYAGAMQAFNQLGTLQQRLGNRSWAPVPVVVEKGMPVSYGLIEGSGIWGRLEGSDSTFEPKTSTSGTDYDVSTWKLQAGIDVLLAEMAAGQLIGGISGHYGEMSADVSSLHGTGSIKTKGYGVGGALTWYADNGFYVDGQGQATWYKSDLHSRTAALDVAHGNDGFGYALSIEAGKRIDFGPKWSVTPQAQLTYSSIDFDDFTDAFGARVSLDDGESLVGRAGVTLDREAEWRDGAGRTTRSHLYGIANLYYDFENGTKVDVAGTGFQSRSHPTWGGAGLGGSLNFADDKYSVYGEALAKTTLEDFGDSHTISGTVGFRAKW